MSSEAHTGNGRDQETKPATTTTGAGETSVKNAASAHKSRGFDPDFGASHPGDSEADFGSEGDYSGLEEGAGDRPAGDSTPAADNSGDSDIR